MQDVLFFGKIFFSVVAILLAVAYAYYEETKPDPEIDYPTLYVSPPKALDRIWCLEVGDPVRTTCARLPQCECRGG